MTTKVLVLCHGNINRSPLCAALLEKYGKGQLQIASAGFVNPNRRAAKKMRDAAAELAISLDAHRSQLVTREMLMDADLVVYMDNGNLRRLNELLNGSAPDVVVACLGKWHEPEAARIPDPAFMARGSAEFDDVVRMIDRASRKLAQELIAE